MQLNPRIEPSTAGPVRDIGRRSEHEAETRFGVVVLPNPQRKDPEPQSIAIFRLRVDVLEPG